jgi:hypothetical protein
MSGGHFDYNQYQIQDIIEKLESHLNGTEPFYEDYSQETLDEFNKGLDILKKAYVYSQRIDWLLSADDGESTFHRRLNEELDALE